ncbi:hypothetical protein BH09SUM1_BH09SUM1_13690 [soil metagenome]
MDLIPDKNNWQQIYGYLVNAVAPRPIGFISTVDAEGKPNLAPFSFFNMVSANPPVCMFSASIEARGLRKKDSLLNAEATREFGVNIVTEEIGEMMNQTSFPYEHGVSEFEKSGLTMIAAEAIRAPLVAECPVTLECYVLDIKSFGEEGGAGHVVFGQIARVHIKPEILGVDGKIDPSKLHLLGRMGGPHYVRTRDQFTMNRPKQG